MKIMLVNFKDGVYLHGQVKQTIGCGLEQNQGAAGVTGVTRVNSIEALGEGIKIDMGGNFFFVPWTSIASCRLHPEPAATQATPIKKVS